MKKQMAGKEFDSVILDVDGTLWDSTSIVAGAWTRAVRECGISDVVITADMLKGLFGKTMSVIAEALLPQLDERQRKQIMELCCRYEQEALEQDECKICYPGVSSTIQALSKTLRVCIVSNCQAGYIELFLKKTGLGGYVTDIECFGNNGRNKDENIRLVTERNAFRAPVYVGDTQGDRDAACAAGVPFIFASYGFGQVDRADAMIERFDELLSLL